ncbi:kinase-like protein [Dissoconium aciculare CBS 342.82]|uniref:non-specific serine/threonine protein kinase n=1 Tax=Dissoconium aciculare CBS 342.82 TaxID=1314786 RepID=A0A6J3LXM2_9PEZI|nr:kinase-like protein [Dissoconium aciculare CBS 342.82]KAF1820044.1 kinase-like protein [Dissoconium aciculare CBS 342.82]
MTNMYTTLAKQLKASMAISVCHQPWAAPAAIASRLNPLQPIEEENTPYYQPENFYPVQLGQVLQERYQVATKLGYGSSSTVWLARDLWRYRWNSERFVAIKVSSNRQENDTCPELTTLRLISKANPRHEGWNFIRRLEDSFSIGGVDREHICLVFEPMREPLWLYARRFTTGVIPSEILKVMLQMILHGLDYLHTECQIIHTDLKPDNIMVKIEDSTILERDAKDEYQNPLPQKHIDGRVIYLSRNDYGQPSVPIGIVQIVDFDRSVSGKLSHSGCIQADVYRAPEVILDAGYTYSADIWSLGVMLWDLLEGNKLFNVIDSKETDEYDEHLHLAQITALLGARPKDFGAGQRTSMFYNTNGDLRKKSLINEQFNFESAIRSVGGEEKEMFIKFVKRMIRWRPNERSTAKELLDDPWLYTDFSQDR